MAEKVEYELSLRDLLSSKIDAANASVNRLEKSMGNVKGSAINLGSALGVTFGIAGVVAFTKSVITAGTTVENALTGLTTLLKDSKEAQQVIDNTMDDAQKTPFAFEGLLAANKALISAGTSSKDAREGVLNLANAIAATGGGDNELQRMVVNLQQIKNTGKATALDIKQFAFAGVNIYKVLEAAGIKAKQKGDDTVVTYEQITEALKKAHEAGGIYENGLENMAGNTSVKISNLGNAFFQLSVKIFNDLKPAIEAIIEAMFKFIGWLKQGWEWMVKHKEILKMVTIGLGTTWLAFKTIAGAKAIIASITLAIEALSVGAAGATAATSGLAASMSAALGPIGLVAAAVGTVVMAYNSLAFSIENAKNLKDEFYQPGYGQGQEDVQAIIGGKGSEAEKLAKITEEHVALQAEIAKREQNLKKIPGYKIGDQNVIDYVNSGGIIDDVSELFSGKNKSAALKESAAISVLKSRDKAFQEAVSKGASLIPKKAANIASGSAASSAKKSGEKNQATGSKAVTINVSIKDLIGTYNMNVTNVKEMGSKVKDIVVQALAGAVNDFQITAGS